MERVAPRQVLYEQQLPLAIESTSQRRIFFPEGGSKYGPSGNGANPNIIRIPINADDLLDPTESFLQFKFNNVSGRNLAMDVGVPFIRRMRIESSGNTLEDINEYGNLYAQLMCCQASQGAYNEATITTSGLTATNGTSALTNIVVADNTSAYGTPNQAEIRAGITATKDLIVTAVNAMTGAVTLGGNHPGTNIATGTSVFFNIPLVSALLNSQKYLPLVFMNGGLVLELELDIPQSAGHFSAGGIGAGFEIENVRYMGHMVSLQRDFYDKLRMVMEGSGGVLQLAGTTYRHFQSTYANATSTSVPLPAKVKSMKGLLFTEKNTADIGDQDRFYVGDSLINGTNEYQLRVGSMTYPPTSIKVDNSGGVVTNKGEAYQELRKLFGTLGDYTHGGVLLNNATYMAGNPNAEHASQGGAGAITGVFNPKGLSLESFKGNLESGINSADKNLSMSLELRRSGGPNITTRVDMYAMCDAIFYVNLDGSVTSSV